MRRTLNSTGRKRITLDKLVVEPRVNGDNKSLYFSWDLAGLELDSDAEVIIEVSTTGQSYRVSAGKLADGIGSFEVHAPTFSQAKSARSKIVVAQVNPVGVRIILATSAGISALFEEEEMGGASPLPIQLRDDLKTIWQLDFSSGKPVLLVTNSEGIYADLKSNPLFFPTMLPQVIKEIAFQLLTNPSSFEDGPQVWHEFFESIGLSQSERERLQADGDGEETSLERWSVAEGLAAEFVVKKRILSEIRKILEEDNL